MPIHWTKVTGASHGDSACEMYWLFDPKCSSCCIWVLDMHFAIEIRDDRHLKCELYVLRVDRYVYFIFTSVCTYNTYSAIET